MDNFVVGDDIAAALGLAEKTWRPKLVAYEAKMAADKNIKDKDQAQKKKKQRYRTELALSCQGLRCRCW